MAFSLSGLSFQSPPAIVLCSTCPETQSLSGIRTFSLCPRECIDSRGLHNHNFREPGKSSFTSQVVPGLERQKQEEQEFEASLDNIRPVLKITMKKQIIIKTPGFIMHLCSSSTKLKSAHSSCCWGFLRTQESIFLRVPPPRAANLNLNVKVNTFLRVENRFRREFNPT